MVDINQLLSDPNLCAQIQSIDFTPFLKGAEIALFPFIRSVVQYLKVQWPKFVPSSVAPLVAYALSFGSSFLISPQLGATPTQSTAIAIVTGLLAILYHDFKDSGKSTVVTVQK